MFRGQCAWFSQSVGPGPQELWAAGGGTLARWREAEYLFSSDAEHPDTRRIHKSLDYLEGRATVFHARYLSAWAGSSTGTKPPVPLGHFVLPPACLQEEIRRKIGCFIWEQADDPPAGEPSMNLREEPEVVGEGSEEEEEEEMVHLDNSSEEEATGSSSPARGEFLYRALREYPRNNMVTGYPSARDMKKYVGELRDFTPGASGYAVYWIHNGIRLSSEGKSRKC